MQIDWALLSVLGAFFAGMLAVGAWASRKQKSAADFYVGGRRFGALTVTATQVASAFGGGMLIAHVGLGYAFGAAEMVYMTAIALGVLALGLTAARWLRKQDFYTTTDWMVHQYGDSRLLRGLTSVTAMLVTMSWWVSQPIAAGKVMHSLAGLPVELGIALSAIVVIIYTMTGGIIAVAYTDLAQLGLMLLGMVVLLPLALSEAGGLDAVLAAQPPENMTAWAPGKTVVVGWVLAVLPGQMVLQLYHQRIFAARTERIAMTGLRNLAVSCLLAGAWATVLGMALYKLNPNLADRDAAVTWCVTSLLPRTVGVLVLGAVVAAIVSTADSALHSTSASITRDIYQGLVRPDATDAEVLRFSRRCIAAVGAAGVAAGIAMPSIIEVLVLGYTMTVSGLFFPLFLGRFWRGATRSGAIAGMVLGVLTTLVLSLVPGVQEVFPPIGGGLAASLVSMVAVSVVMGGGGR
jgi:SSS family transporter